MDNEKENKLQHKFPIFLRDMHGDMMKTCMAWGCECGDGWYAALEKLCAAIEKINTESKTGKIIASQIKAKFGNLCVYWSWETEGELENPPEDIAEEIEALIKRADTECGMTCEVCGHYEEGADYCKHYNLCDMCWKKAQWRKPIKEPLNRHLKAAYYTDTGKAEKKA